MVRGMSRSIEFVVNADGVALLRVNRPAARNALTGAVSYTHLTLPTNREV